MCTRQHYDATMPSTQPLTFRLPLALYERLRAAAFERRESQNAIVVKALERELAESGAAGASLGGGERI